jgi:integrase
MAWITKTPKGHYCARYRGPDRKERSRTFPRKRDAQDWLTKQGAAISSGDWTDPRHRRRTVSQLGEVWLQTKKHLKASSRMDYLRIWSLHVEPKWGGREIGTITTSEIKAWVAELREHLSVSRTRRAIMILRQILDNAIEDRILGRNPVTASVKAGTQARSVPRALTHAEVKRLIKASETSWRPVIQVLAYSGLRLSEAAALKVQHLHLDARPPEISVEVAEVEVGGTFDGDETREYRKTGEPKSWQHRRVPQTQTSLRALTKMSRGKAGDAYVFTPEGEQLDGKRFREALREACERARINPPITPHNLRDTAATLAIQAGANIKAVQAMLGHASATMTLDRYAAVLPSDFGTLISVIERAEMAQIAEPQRNQREIRRAR